MEEEVRSVSADELKAGIRAQAGHRLVLVVDGVKGARPGLKEAGPDDEGARPDPVLGDARWIGSDLEHGDTATMEVAVEQGEGRRVRFTLERNDGGQWSPCGTAEATVADGKARAEAPLEHPAHTDGDPFAEAEDQELRFRCELV
jgi:hypothetical protein